MTQPPLDHSAAAEKEGKLLIGVAAGLGCAIFICRAAELCRHLYRADLDLAGTAWAGLMGRVLMKRHFSRLLVVLLLISLLIPPPAALAATGGSPARQPACDGSLYRVQQGDSWSRLAQRTNVSLAALKAANPVAAQHPQGWLIVGQLLCVPAGAVNPAAAPQLSQPAGEWIITVRRGNSWAVLAARFGLSVAALQAANPQAIRPGEVLRAGDQISVPLTASLTERIACPTDLTVVGPAAGQVLSEFAGSPDVLRSYLQRCGAFSDDWGAVRRGQPALATMLRRWSWWPLNRSRQPADRWARC